MSRRIATVMLADFILMGQDKVGSYALSTSKTRIFATAIEAWLDLIANVINEQAIKPLLRVNGLPRETSRRRCDQATLRGQTSRSWAPT